MAFVAASDGHGNEIMRIMLCMEPGNRTVASCHNLKINCGPAFRETPYGRYDHLARFHTYAYSSMFDGNEHYDSDNVESNGEREQEYVPGRCEGDKVAIVDSLDMSSSASWTASEVHADSTLLTAAEKDDRARALRAQRRGSRASLACDGSMGASLSSRRSRNEVQFDSWLATKNEAQQQQALERRNEAEQRAQDAQERARLAEVTYRDWCEGKATQLRRARSDLSESPTMHSHAPLPAPEATRRLQLWEREKVNVLRAQRQLQERQALQEQQAARMRRQQAAEAWELWIQASRHKPKPVPIGQGLDSLRSCMSPIHTNPNEWQSPAVPQRVEQPQVEGRPAAPAGPDYMRIDRLAQPRKQLWLKTFQQPVKLDALKAKSTQLPPTNRSDFHCDRGRHSSRAASLHRRESNRLQRSPSDGAKIVSDERAGAGWRKRGGSTKCTEMRYSPIDCSQGSRRVLSWLAGGNGHGGNSDLESRTLPHRKQPSNEAVDVEANKLLAVRKTSAEAEFKMSPDAFVCPSDFVTPNAKAEQHLLRQKQRVVRLKEFMMLGVEPTREQITQLINEPDNAQQMGKSIVIRSKTAPVTSKQVAENNPNQEMKSVQLSNKGRGTHRSTRELKAWR